MKQQNTRTLIYKISTKKLRINNWNVEMPNLRKSIKDKEVIALGSNQFFRALYRKNGMFNRESELKQLKRELKSLKKDKKHEEAFNKTSEINEKLLCTDIISVEVDNNREYDRAYKGFYVDGVLYKELIGTTGGVKNRVIFFIKDELLEWAENRLNNGRDMRKKFIPSKLQAYKALDFSASVEVSMPKNIIVMNDGFTKFTDSVIELSIDENDMPVERVVDDYEVEYCINDGFGLISPSQEEKWREELQEHYQISAMIVRHSYCKGAVATFDSEMFADEIAKNEWVLDIWGDRRNIREADLILTGSMVKLWDSYDNMEHYFKCCESNDHNFGITKITPEKLDNERNLNYQFIQPMALSDDDIDKLLMPTIEELHDILGDNWEKKVLFSRGLNVTSSNVDGFDYDFIKALMIDERMKNDPFVMNKLHKMIEKRIKDAKIGVIKVRGNYSIVIGDPYALSESFHGMEVKGLLGANEMHMNYWKDIADKVCILRAPMSSINNIKQMIVVNNALTDKWFKYVKQCSILNSWDTTTHTINGADLTDLSTGSAQ